jgi:cyclopropane-fatty-acyl-phospholipid synthase
MFQNRFHKLETFLSSADVSIGGSRPWDIQVHQDTFYPRILKGGSLGLGESYMDGWWDCDQLDEFFHRILRIDLESKFKAWQDTYATLRAKLINLQKPSRAFHVGQHHYNISNKLYRCMLDKRLIYSCGLWENANTLDQAQEAKLALISKKLNIQPGMRILDIGCGWGGTAQYIAERFQVNVVGITVSEEQKKYAKILCRGLPVEIHLQDYRNLTGTFDRILSVGMFEHVGYKNYASFMQVVHRCLKNGGLFLLQTIGSNLSTSRTDPWIEAYIFPNSMLPSAKQINTATEGLFLLEDWHNFGQHYDKTLLHWFQNFHDNWDSLKADYSEQFYQMWKYYLLSCAGAFRAKKNQLWQILFLKK